MDAGEGRNLKFSGKGGGSRGVWLDDGGERDLWVWGFGEIAPDADVVAAKGSGADYGSLQWGGVRDGLFLSGDGVEAAAVEFEEVGDLIFWLGGGGGGESCGWCRGFGDVGGGGDEL